MLATTEQIVRQRLEEGCQVCGLPRHMWRELVEYVMVGRPTCEFLGALLSNDLMRTMEKADHLNADRLKDYGTWLVSVAPIGCFGSVAAYNNWVRTGGVIGQQAALTRKRGSVEQPI